jgi:TetR/AcrR family transcriptional regulator
MAARKERIHPSRRRDRRRGPGRPTEREGGRDVREALLEVAGRLFSERGVDAVSLRELGRAAGVTAAMVHYYFGDKQGLYEALLERALSRVLAGVREIVESGGEGTDEIGGFLRVLVGALSSERWIPSLIIREVIADNGRFRERFIREFASQMAGIVPEVLRRELATGRLRPDLDLRLGFVSLLGMTAWPFAVRPVLERVLGLDFDAEGFEERFSEHTRRLFLEGVLTREADL